MPFLEHRGSDGDARLQIAVEAEVAHATAIRTARRAFEIGADLHGANLRRTIGSFKLFSETKKVHTSTLRFSVSTELFTGGNNSGNLPFGARKEEFSAANIFPINYFQKSLEPYHPW